MDPQEIQEATAIPGIPGPQPVPTPPIAPLAPSQTGPTLAEGCRQYLRVVEATRTKTTFDVYKLRLSQALRQMTFAQQRIHTIVPMDIVGYFTNVRHRYAGRSLNLTRAVLIQAWRFFKSRGWARKNVARIIRAFPITTRDIPQLTIHQEQMILGYIKRQKDWEAQCAIILAIETGLRIGNLLGLLLTDITPPSGAIKAWLTLPGSKMKNRRMLRVPLSDRAWRAISQWVGYMRGMGRQVEMVFPHLTRDRLRRRWHEAKDFAGCVADFRIHDLRKVFLTRLRRKGVQLEIAMQLSGHHDYRTCLEIYRLVDSTDLEIAVSSPYREHHDRGVPDDQVLGENPEGWECEKISMPSPKSKERSA